MTEMTKIESLRMRNDNVLVRIERQQWLGDRAAEAGIILPDVCAAPEAHEGLIGVVVHVGPGYYPDRRMKPERPSEPSERSPVVSARTLVPTSVRVGERVILDGRDAGDQVWSDDGAEYRVVREAEILGVVEE
jgi:co-chaperonin GroES (HSP10)